MGVGGAWQGRALGRSTSPPGSLWRSFSPNYRGQEAGEEPGVPAPRPHLFTELLGSQASAQCGWDSGQWLLELVGLSGPHRWGYGLHGHTHPAWPTPVLSWVMASRRPRKRTQDQEVRVLSGGRPDNLGLWGWGRDPWGGTAGREPQASWRVLVWGAQGGAHL